MCPGSGTGAAERAQLFEAPMRGLRWHEVWRRVGLLSASKARWTLRHFQLRPHRTLERAPSMCPAEAGRSGAPMGALLSHSGRNLVLGPVVQLCLIAQEIGWGGPWPTVPRGGFAGGGAGGGGGGGSASTVDPDRAWGVGRAAGQAWVSGNAWYLEGGREAGGGEGERGLRGGCKGPAEDGTDPE